MIQLSGAGKKPARGFKQDTLDTMLNIISESVLEKNRKNEVSRSTR
jgi:hypothetical protein